MALLLKRYESTIYGNYRKAGLCNGLLGGVVLLLALALYNLLADTLSDQPAGFVVEAVLVAVAVVSGRHYRNNLPEGKVTFKEMMLFLLLMTVVSAAAYGLLLWGYASLVPSVTESFIEGRLAQMDVDNNSPEMQLAIAAVQRYSAGDWGFIGAFRLSIFGLIVSFFTALAYRNENPKVRISQPKQKSNQKK